MKKTLLNKILAPIGKGIIIFAVFGLSIYAYAAVNFPSSDPEPVTGVVGMFVGVTNNSFSATSNYVSVNNFCKTGDITVPGPPVATMSNAGAHVCTANELINSYNHGSVAIGFQAGVALINNGPPGFTSFSNDCLGWHNITGDLSGDPVYGAIWDFDLDYGKLNKCNDIVSANFSFACCL